VITFIRFPGSIWTSVARRFVVTVQAGAPAISAPALLCATLEIALNRYLRLEPAALEDCARLEGKVIALDAADLAWTVYIEPMPSGVRVAAEFVREPDVRVAAPAAKLLRLALATAAGHDGLPTGLDIVGDTELLTRFNATLKRVGFDPEELAAKVIGDAAAHRLVGGLKGLLGWGRNAADRFSADAAEYLVEGSGDLARAADIEGWMDAVDQLRDAAERFDARLAILERKVGE
jgi:ubiquinone biosynthesis protein UbiJ